jgi:LSD1 subclass zinc finger protein
MEQTARLDATLQCSGCGATLHFAPGTSQLQCSYCGASNEIVNTDTRPIVSFDYDTFINSLHTDSSQQTARIVACKNCGAQTTLPPEVNSDNCVFCASPLVLSDAESKLMVRPHYILPFAIAQKEAFEAFRNWMKKLWFAPSDLSKKVTNNAGQLKGMYIPHWSYDADTESRYTGERGDYYYTTERYTETVNGREETRTREVRHTRWTSVSGDVTNRFDDVLVSASKSLPENVSTKLEPWKLGDLTHYNEQYVSGFRSELYQLDAVAGLVTAKDHMDPVIRQSIVDDIGGDEQRIDSYDTDYFNLALKYILLPAWISSYKYNEKLYHFTVNASTGEVVGERPYSVIKITLAVLAGLIIIGLIVYLYYTNR